MARTGIEGAHARDPGSERPPAILLGGGSALAVARSLGRDGMPVIVLAHKSDSVRWSRHCRFVETTGPDSQESWLEWLGQGPREGVLLPCNDDALELIVNHRATLEGLGYVAFEADDEVARAMLDKARTYELARDIGIPVPRTVTLEGDADLASAAAEIGFPCALKPRHSHRFAHHFGMSKKVLLAEDAQQFALGYARLAELGVAVLATEIVPGRDDASFCSYYSYLDERGEPLFHMTKRKLRQSPAHFGLGCYHVTDWNPEVAELGLRFLQGVGLRGLAFVEFKRDARDGRLKLIECNHRFLSIMDLPIAAGFDLPLFTYNRIVGRPTPPLDSYRRGVHYWWAPADFRAFLGYRRSGELSFAGWVGSLLHRQRFQVASLRDPLPAIGVVAHKLKRRALARLRPGAADKARDQTHGPSR